jgi:hypothetical protein
VFASNEMADAFPISSRKENMNRVTHMNENIERLCRFLMTANFLRE